MPLPKSVDALLSSLGDGDGLVVWLTGAGISAESGIPTFRGKEGYWRVGSRNYHPQEMATLEAFSEMPWEVWAWYLYRRSVCRAAGPNVAHRALAEQERSLGDRFVLITQNVDGLHLQAGNTLRRTYQVHGNIDYMRCSRECVNELFPIPDGVSVDWPKDRTVGDAERALLACPRCGAKGRPHVLWFDEFYDEAKFRWESSIAAAAAADLLVVVGTAGQTNLPLQVGAVVARRGAPMIVVNPEPSPFTEMAEQSPSGLYLEGLAGELVPPLCERVAGLL